MPSRYPSLIGRWWPLIAIGALALGLVAAKLSLRSAATGQPIIPGVAGAPVLGPEASTPSPRPVLGRLNVHVTDGDGLAVAEVSVDVRDQFNTLVGQVQTDPRGNGQVVAPAASGYVLTARKAGLAATRVNQVEIPRVQPGQPFPTVEIRLAPASNAAARGARLYVGQGPAGISLIDAASNLVLKRSEPLGQGRATFLAVGSDSSKLFAALSGNADLLELDSTELTVRRKLTLGAGGITSLAMNPRTGRLWISMTVPDSTNSSTLLEMDPAAEQVLRQVSLGLVASGLRFRQDGAMLYVSSRSASALALVDPSSGLTVHTVALPQWPSDVALSPDMKSLYVVSALGSNLLEFDALNGDRRRMVDLGTGASGVVAHPDGQRLFVVNQQLGYVQVVDLAGGQVVDTIPVGRAPQAAALSADGAALYVANFGSGTVSVVDTAKGSIRDTLAASQSPSSLLLLNQPA